MLVLAALPLVTGAQSSAVTYQGQLRDNGTPVLGNVNLRFQLYDSLTGGNPIGSPEQRLGVPVEDGLFQVELDFGAAAFDGSDRFLEIEVNGAPLSPRQRVTATPYALLAGGIASGSIGGSDVDPSQIQLRVTGSCPTGEYVRIVNQDGSVVCGEDASSGGTVTSIDTGSGLIGGPITDSGTLSVAPGGIGAAQIDPTQVQRRVSGTCPTGQSIRQIAPDGTVICEVDDVGPPAWSLTGNAGTSPASNFIGTTDSQPLVLRAANARGLRIEPSVQTFGGLPITTNIITGSAANEVQTGVRGATISGGGVPFGDSDPDYPDEAPDRVTDNYGSIGGGWGNLAGNDNGQIFDARFSTVGGGKNNIASGFISTIGGGRDNAATDTSTTIAGGRDNTASDFISTVGGGSNNTASGQYSTISGGRDNTASGLNNSTVGGGFANMASSSSVTVSGGSNNAASGASSTVSGGPTTAQAVGTRGPEVLGPRFGRAPPPATPGRAVLAYRRPGRSAIKAPSYG